MPRTDDWTGHEIVGPDGKRYRVRIDRGPTFYGSVHRLNEHAITLEEVPPGGTAGEG